MAFVVLREGAGTSKEELLAFLATRIARYKLPEDIRFTHQLPRTSSGKLLRRELPHL
jgi:acyl-coenzyme A synthetase/AMP-(fatty) acid ligase